MKNSQRLLVKAVREICDESNIALERYSYDWILRLAKDGKTMHIFGYQFENNSSAAQMLCTDKSAASELLLAANIPAIEHTFFTAPENFQFIGVEGNWQRMCDLLDQHGRLVVKPNEGTGGIDVFQVSTNAELEAAVNAVFAHNRSLAICPYYEVEQEYRILLLNNNVELVYSKNIPMLTGDGKSSIRQLILARPSFEGLSDLLTSLDEKKLQSIPALNERVPVGWKHNLGQGAAPQIITDSRLKDKLASLALQAAHVLNVNFASVDVILSGGMYQILEVNSGIMMENFAQISAENYETAKSIYKKAILSYFGN